MRQPPHHEVALERLRAQDVVLLLGFEGLRLDAVVEAERLRAEPRVRAHVALVARVGEPFAHLQVLFRVLVVQGGAAEAEQATYKGDWLVDEVGMKKCRRELTGKASQMVHLVLQPVKLHVRHVRKAARACSDHVLDDGLHGVVVHLAGFLVLVARLDPRLQQVLVEAVPEGAQRHVLLAPLAGLRVQVVRVQTLGLFDVLQDGTDRLDALPVHGIAGDVRQVRELQVERAELGQDAAAAAGPAVVFTDLLEVRGKALALLTWRKRLKERDCKNISTLRYSSYFGEVTTGILR